MRASAEAITTKTLKGVCGSAEMNLALHNLEMKLFGELQEIKKLLTQLKNVEDDYSGNESKTTMRSVLVATTTTVTTTKSIMPPTSTPHSTTKPIQLKVLHEKDKHDESREWEVRKLNNTLLTDGKDTKIFSYYWKLENFSSKISNLEEKDEESYIFTILGKPLRIRASFNHMKRNFLYLKLESAKFDLRDRFQSIVMDMSNSGGTESSSRTTIFKEIREALHFIHKISILDQVCSCVVIFFYVNFLLFISFWCFVINFGSFVYFL